MNNYWIMVPYKLFIFCWDQKLKFVATTGYFFTIKI